MTTMSPSKKTKNLVATKLPDLVCKGRFNGHNIVLRSLTKDDLVASKSPSEEGKKNRYNGHQIVPHNLVWNDLVATRSPREKQNKI
jgi:hypothetical protein